MQLSNIPNLFRVTGSYAVAVTFITFEYEKLFIRRRLCICLPCAALRNRLCSDRYYFIYRLNRRHARYKLSRFFLSPTFFTRYTSLFVPTLPFCFTVVLPEYISDSPRLRFRKVYRCRRGFVNIFHTHDIYYRAVRNIRILSGLTRSFSETVIPRSFIASLTVFCGVLAVTFAPSKFTSTIFVFLP